MKAGLAVACPAPMSPSGASGAVWAPASIEMTTRSPSSVTWTSSDLGAMATPWAVAGSEASTKSRGVGDAVDGP